MVATDPFASGDYYLDFPAEDAKFRYDEKSGKVYRHFYGEAEREILPGSDRYN